MEPDFPSFIGLINMLKKSYDCFIQPVMDKYSMTRIEIDILMFLANNPQYSTASDIVNKRMLTKSHVSYALNTLEQNGYIRREYRNNNRKTAYIVLLEKAEDIIADGKKAQLEYGKTVSEGIDREQFREMLMQMSENLNKSINAKQEEK